MNAKELIIVACHAIFIGEKREDILNDDKWILFPFQKGEPKYYVEHLKTGIKLSFENLNSVLVISGGKTRKEATNISEAESYLKIAEMEKWFGFQEVKGKTFLEEYARDSFENLLFSLCKYFELHSKLPLKTYLITWKFKEERYNFHSRSLGLTSDEFEFIGVNNPEDLDLAIENEKRTLLEFKSDPYGTAGILREKKQIRNPLKLIHPYNCYLYKDILEDLKF
ncbi:MAG: YdcF family protein [Ignavibacteria bacterium]|nr:YdcF family protein [Ignavibacteria bacterium]